MNYKQATHSGFFQVEDWEELHHMANSLAKVTRLTHMDLSNMFGNINQVTT